MDIVEYTNNEIRKNLALLEIHLKQAPFDDKNFCEECINKHILILEGLAEEGLTSCVDCDVQKFELLLRFLNQIKEKKVEDFTKASDPILLLKIPKIELNQIDYQKQGIELAKQIRRLRKKFVPCTGENLGMLDRDDIKEKINNLIEDLHAAKDKVSQDRISYGIYILNSVLRGRKCWDG